MVPYPSAVRRCVPRSDGRGRRAAVHPGAANPRHDSHPFHCLVRCRSRSDRYLRLEPRYGPRPQHRRRPLRLHGQHRLPRHEGGGVWKSTNAAASASSVTFAPLTDTLTVWPSNILLSSLTVGAVSVQPGGTGVILAGTGDPNSGSGSWYGAGILRSTDGGVTWSLIWQTAPSSVGLTYSFRGAAFSGFAWNPSHPNLVVAAVASPGNRTTVVGALSSLSTLGLYYSQDAGATWHLATIEDGTQVIQGEQYIGNQGNAATAVVWNPVRQRFYAAIRFHGYYESLDGITWSRLTNQPGANLTLKMCPTNPGAPASQACPVFRGALAVQPTTGDLYALSVDTNNLDQGLWQDACRLKSGACSNPTVQFATRLDDTSLHSPAGSSTLAQADASLWLAAVPSQQDTLLFLGSQDIWRCSLANSCVWRNTTNTQSCSAAQVAPGQHAIDATLGASGLLYFGNDGGLWRSTDSVDQQKAVCSSDDANHYQNLNSGLGSLAQISGFAQDPATPPTWLAALGPLGTAAPGADTTTPWTQVLDGEGDAVAIDPAAPSNWYATSIGGVGINRCAEGTGCDRSAFGNVAIGESQVDNDFQSVPAPWILDPVNTANIILGTCRVWRGSADGSGWSDQNLLSPMLDQVQQPSCDGNAEIRTLAAAPILSGTSAGNGAEQLYAGMAGALDGGGLVAGHLFTATVNDGSQSSNTRWTDTDASPVANPGQGGTQFNPAGYGISSIVPDPHDPTGQTVYITIQGVSGALQYAPTVYRSTDAGAHWTNLTSNLPSVPANSILIDPNDANIVYVATDKGLYFTNKVSGCAATGSACWNLYGTGLPTSPVVGLMAINEGATQKLRAATWGRGIWEIDLATAGIAPTTASAQPTALTFPSQRVQTLSDPQTITLTNTGHLNLNVTSLDLTGDFTETDNCVDQSLPVKASCQISVLFDPSQSGPATGLLTVYANVSGGQLTVPLSGTGLAPASVVLTPSALTFAGLTVGSTSGRQYITLANTGDIAATITSAAVSGDFSIAVNSCPASLAGNYSCTLGIVFSPTASGIRSGRLTVVDSVGTQTALLSGTGQNPATDTLSATALTFAPQQVSTTSAPQSIVLTNSGDQLLTGIAVSVTGDFAAVNNCGTTLQAQSTCGIAVTFTPTVAAAESGTVTVTDQFRTRKIALTGTGLAPPGASALPASIAFGGYAIGTTSSVQTVTVTNSGGYDLTGLAVAITSGFTVATNNCSATVAVGATCRLGITFSPAAAGSVSGTLTVSAANLPKALTVSLSGQGQDFGLSVSGSSTAIVSSGQTASFSLQLSGLGGATGTVSLNCAGAPQNSTCSLNPASLTVVSTNTSSAAVTIATGVATSSALAPTGLLPLSGWKTTARLLGFAFPIALLGLRRRAWKEKLLLLILVAGLLTGCGVSSSNGGSGSGGGGGGGGGGGTSNPTPAGTYTLIVTGTMSNIVHTAKLTLTVQ
ncbi:MAG: choice-of-anchor D domain-containing protein [Acidobacteriota bacterium]